LHACPQGIEIGSDTLVMHGAIVHVYNFRSLPHSGIKIGRNSLIGEYSVISRTRGRSDWRSRLHFTLHPNSGC
jgi:carbonic anhydrase/acetyltransferase-like protein (isoleucine patch superfamily)